MAYDQGLAQRLREALEEQPNVVEKAMFGGLAFLVHGNMCIGIIHDDLMVRVGAEENEAALTRPHTRPMDLAKRPMKGYVYVAPEGRVLLMIRRAAMGAMGRDERRRSVDLSVVVAMTLAFGGCPTARADSGTELSGAAGFGVLTAGVTPGQFAISPSASLGV
jgi:TfoX/Sxy family transcriptional regulator of competence genes